MLKSINNIVDASLITGTLALICFVYGLIIGNGFVIVSFFLGIIGILLSLIPSQKHKRKAGLVISVVVVSLDIVLFVAVYYLITKYGFGIE